MSIWKQLLSGLRGAAAALNKPQPPAEMTKLQGPGRYRVEVVGESFYKEAFLDLLGELAYTDRELRCEANLVPENDNPHDRNAVGVYIKGRRVGYLSRDQAVGYREIIRQHLKEVRAVRADAEVYAGGEDGMFSVRLDI